MNKIVLLTTFLIIATIAHTETADVSDTNNLSPTLALSVNPQNYHHLKNVFKDTGYSWDSLSKGVPPMIIQSLPDDLDLLTPVSEKKKIFFLSLLPMILLANEHIEQQRRELETLIQRYDAGESLSREHRNHLSSLVSEYDLDGDPLNDMRVRRRLFERIDIIPPSLALAQAANESAWGTSRFTQLANNLFGEWTFASGTGLVPHDRPPGATHEIRRFDSIFSAITSYIKNLNTHSAYNDLRKERYRLRTEGLPVRGIDLTMGLLRYSERREEYVRDIQKIIRQNNLSTLSSAKLRPHTVVKTPPTETSLTPPPFNPYSRRSSLRIDP